MRPITLVLVLTIIPTALPCSVLSQEQCADTCVPFDAGTTSQTDFSCGDWWINAKCCNGTKSQTIVTSKYYECSCQIESVTAGGLAVIIVLVVATCASIAAAAGFVLYRKKRKVLADEQQRDKARKEAQVYLPR